MKTLVVLVMVVAVVWAEYTSYEGYKVYHVTPRSEIQLKVLNAYNEVNDFDFWTKLREVDSPVSVMVAPRAQASFVSLLETIHMEYTVLIDDVEKTVAAERRNQARTPKVEKGQIRFDNFLRYHEIVDYLNQLAEEYPDIVSVESIGTTSEQRTIPIIKIGTGSENKPIIVIEAGIHAREWIAPATALYAIHQLVENENNRELVETTDWFIIPTINPDGYEYSHTNSRYWRKTRSRGTKCYGVDGNRNFDYKWMLIGASNDECSDTFAGSYAFSEPETAALRDLVLKYNSRIKLYISLHSYGQYLLYPWGWTSTLPDNVDQLHSLAVDVDAAISSVAGTRYRIGSSTNIFYAASGASDDWAKGGAGIELSYTIELPGGGSYGFDPPPTRILSIGEETWQGFKAYQQYISRNFGAE